MISLPNPHNQMNSSRSSDCRLVWITDDAEQRIAEIARVSNPENQHNRETAPRLLRYLIKHKHWSPFEMCNMCVEINTTRAISAQIIRHRSFSYQEFSQRYMDVGALGSAEIPELRRQDRKNRQNSFNDFDHKDVGHFYRRISELFEDTEHLYQEMVSSGVAKETARAILPMNTRTRIYMNGTIRSWIHYLQIRASEETQYEHRVIAESILGIFADEMPDVYEAAFT
jgi:thymidylate synthase (FAD)